MREREVDRLLLRQPRERLVLLRPRGRGEDQRDEEEKCGDDEGCSTRKPNTQRPRSGRL
jgi:hypothetical protein